MSAETEVTGPSGNTTADNYCSQVHDLQNFGGVTYTNPTVPTGHHDQLTGFWYMLDAVAKHEDVHKAHLLPSLRAKVAEIEAGFTALTVATASGKTREQAAAEIKSLGGYERAVKACAQIWFDEYYQQAASDHNAGGDCDRAELDATRPMRTQICT
jgi:predicted secreted Zn-dependent protease